MVLTVITAVLGLLVGLGTVHWMFVAIAGVVSGLWWGFGRTVLRDQALEHDAYKQARNAARREGRRDS